MKTLSINFPTSQSTRVSSWIALTLWVIIAVLHIGLFFVDHYFDYYTMQEPCDGEWTLGESECDWIVLSSAEEAVLESWGLSLRHYAIVIIAASMMTLTVYVSLGLVILWRMGATRLGLLVSIALVSIPYAMTSGSAVWGNIHPYLIYPGMIANIIGNTLQITFLYLLPNGRFSPRWAYIPLLITIFFMIQADLFNNQLIPEYAVPILIPVLISFVLLGAFLQIYRYFRDSTPIEQQQTRWILMGIIAYVTSIILWIIVFGRAIDIPPGQARIIANVVEWVVGELLLIVLPVAIAIAILRYQLWDINIIINRTLVFGGLTIMVVLIYTVIVGGLSLFFQLSGNFFISLIATALIAIIFQPARERLQQAINRLMFGERDDPYTVLSRLGQQLQTTAVPDETLNAIVKTIAATLKLPFVAIEMVEQDIQIGRAMVGEAVAEIVTLPLRYQKETVGCLLVSPRAPDEKFTPQEQQLLSDIAAQIGPVVSATRLTLALQHSREKLVMTREEERRRIRRDLHDGLGPTLASQTLILDVVLDFLAENDVKPAAEHVKQLKSQTQQMVTDIRQLVYELRPPALDELGLLEALRAHVAQMRGANGQLRISIEAMPEPLPPLPAALEVAAYRIALEGVTNVIRHAQARDCRVRFVISNDKQPSILVLTVTDDGVGLPANVRSGVGLMSMRERAEELGGRCEVVSNQSGGTRVTANLPFIVRGES